VRAKYDQTPFFARKATDSVSLIHFHYLCREFRIQVDELFHTFPPRKSQILVTTDSTTRSDPRPFFAWASFYPAVTFIFQYQLSLFLTTILEDYDLWLGRKASRRVILSVPDGKTPIPFQRLRPGSSPGVLSMPGTMSIRSQTSDGLVQASPRRFGGMFPSFLSRCDGLPTTPRFSS